MQALYDVKTAAERQAMADFAAAQRLAEQAERERDRCGQTLALERGKLEQDARRGITILEFRSRSAYGEQLAQRMAALETELGRARETVLKRQAALRAIHKDKKALERVREFQRTAFLKAEAAKEAKEMDDLLTPRMIRRM